MTNERVNKDSQSTSHFISDKSTVNLTPSSIPEDSYSPSEPLQSPQRFTDVIPFRKLHKSQRRTEVERLHLDTLPISTDLLNSGKRLLHSSKTLFMTSQDESEEAARLEQEVLTEHQRTLLQDEEIKLRPLQPGQTDPFPLAPERYHFEYIYQHIDDHTYYPYIEQLEKWRKFVNKHNIYKTDLSVPVQDIDGNEYPDVEVSLDNLLALNKHLLEAHKKEKVIQSEQKKSHNITPADASTSYVLQGDQTLTLCSQADTQVDINSSGSLTSSFVILHTSKDIENTKETDLSKPDTETYSQSESDPDNSDSEFHPASLQNKSSAIVLPYTNTQPNHTSHETSPDIDMGDLS